MTSWEAPRDEGVVIVHLSDLHFGVKGCRDCWRLLADHLKRDVKPALVLVTGDIVDSPKEQLFQDARDALDALGIEYYACPGNHDRYFHGNRFLRSWKSARAAAFDDCFGKRLLRHDRVERLLLDGGRWTLGLVGVDTSRNADFLARGYVEALALQELKGAVREQGAGLDLAILLAHHHLQPVRQLETKHGNVLKRLANVTTLVNAGTFLEAVAEAHVDLVLHGHEHEVHSGIYGSLERGRREVCIVGAGSATGTDTLEGCAETRICYNEIVLCPDRSVRLRVVRYRAGGWEVANELPLYTSANTRRLRLLRHSPQVATPLASQVTKHVEFTRDRSILVHWSFTNWEFFKDDLVFPVENSSGRPDAGRVKITDMLGGPAFEAGVEFLKDRDHQWHFDAKVPAELQRKPVRFDVSFHWAGGAILTREEMAAIAERGGAGRLREKGLEFATVWTDDAVAAAQLVLVLPREFDPGEVRIEVFDKSKTLRAAESEELTALLSNLGPGRYSLVVPYPLPGWDYALAWAPITTPPNAEAERFRQVVDQRGDALVAAFAAEIPKISGPAARTSLYVGVDGVARLLGHHDPVVSAPRPGAELPLRQFPPGPIQDGFRGAPVLVPRPGNPEQAQRLGLLSDEWAVAVVPVGLAHPGMDFAPWAVVRIGLRDRAAAAALQERAGTLQRDLAGPILKLAVEAFATP